MLGKHTMEREAITYADHCLMTSFEWMYATLANHVEAKLVDLRSINVPIFLGEPDEAVTPDARDYVALSK